MKTVVLQKDLNKTLSIASHFVSPRAQLPILSNFKLYTKGASLVVEATNLEMSVSASMGAQTSEEGEIAVPAKILADIVSGLHTEKIELSTDGENLNLLSEGFNANVSALNASDFPEVPSESKKTVDIPKEEFLDAIQKVVFSSSPDDTRPALAGVLVVFGTNAMSLVSSDGFRLSKKDISFKSSDTAKIIVPKNILLELGRMTKDTGNVSLFVNEEEKQIVFTVDGCVFSSRLVEGEYPPFEKIIPTSSSTVVNVSKADFQSAVRLGAIFSRDGASIVTLKVKEGGLSVVGESAKSGSQESTLAAKLEGPAIDILYNYRYLEEFVNVVKGESVVMKFNSATSSGVFLDPSDESYLHLIMPVKS